MKLIVLSLTAAAAVTLPGAAKVLKLNGFTPGGLELTFANQNHQPLRQTGAQPSVRVVATTYPFSVRAR